MLDKLNYLQRLIFTGLAFASFSLGGLLLTLTVFPVIAICSGAEEKRINRTRRMIHLCFRLFVFMLRITGILDCEVYERERLKTANGRLVVANHPTLLDVVFLISMMPKAQCIVKHELWDSKYLGGVMRAAGYIRNDGDPEALFEQCKRAIELGHDIVVFPEGTRTVPGKDLKFQRGFANIAALVPCDIQPVTISCVPPSLAKGQKWYEIPPKKMQFNFWVEEQLDIQAYLGHQPRSKAVRQLTRELEQHYCGKMSHG
ncbi:lysophospholipid acyltransferase family protein [Terasakiella sp. A23]|uniref:lysophospholipid acyltransferase family protein n=1 Tax=Terasakiella sp. FCG-A23 TaxID=3080561 RepID=UPI0029544A66|nr:lysophospholipid acyltransferase family protein [Terasakiella sp. A23]MDV7341020.1 lysophospholipid acyltransferase family protein [Terasakiella sp. A23]